MAWIPRNQWLRKRFGNWQGRPRSFRRRYYNRYWFHKRRGRSTRRRRMLPARRQRVRTRFILRQYNPKYRRRCTIRGWMPLLFCLTDAPFFRPMLLTGDFNSDRSGGWTVTEFTLEGFYKENKIYRNLWSESNCDFDLAKYKGMTLTFYPTQWTDYIVWWDTDYGNYSEFATAVKNIHPAILINKPNTRVVLSVNTRRRYKPVKVHLKPPSIFTNKWDEISVWSERGLAILAVATIDFTYPWLPGGYQIRNPALGQGGWKPPYNVYDYQEGTNKLLVQYGPDKAGNVEITLGELWWNQGAGSSKGKVWLEQWPDWKKAQSGGGMTDPTLAAVAFGPFVVKNQRTECQIVATYRSYWTWGGEVLTRTNTICDPKTNTPKSQPLEIKEIADPKTCLRKEDIGKDGFINPDAWRRLTASPEETGGLTNFKGAVQTEEEETDSTIQEESEDSSPERPRRSRGKLDGRLLDQLLRYRQLLLDIEDQRRRMSY
nr:ORF1 [Torque teno neovison virus]WKF25126.1 ORF1 [Torque teno neovison virus]WKF25129.1 ORF1 [Torque teno neovison virus]WKF25132.1 ORF1 [Torque teno neovison virus]